jgi:hypothetical protein
MGLVASPPGVSARLTPLIVTAVLLWAAPVALGGVLYAIAVAAGTGEGALGILTIAIVLIFSPILSWIGWVVALPAVWWLLTRGMFGWLPALATGLGAGAIAGAITDSELAIPYGIVSLLALRAVLPLRPAR